MIILYPLDMLGTRWTWSLCVHLPKRADCWYSQIGLPSSVVAVQKKCLDCAPTLSRLSLMAPTCIFCERRRGIPKQRRYIQYA